MHALAQALVTGAGPIGMMTAMSALAGGCAKVLIYDPNMTKAKVHGSKTRVPLLFWRPCMTSAPSHADPTHLLSHPTPLPAPDCRIAQPRAHHCH